MKKIICLLLHILPLICFSQNSFDVIYCNEVKLFKICSKTYISACSIKKESLIEKFGTPDSMIFKQISWDLYLCYYGLDLFEVPKDSKFPTNFRLISDKFKFFLKDSLEIQVGHEINKILKVFPKSAQNIKEVEPGIFLLSLIYAYKKEGNVFNTDASVQIRFNSSNKKIVEIRESTLN